MQSIYHTIYIGDTVQRIERKYHGIYVDDANHAMLDLSRCSAELTINI